jgi:hypothetical protein
LDWRLDGTQPVWTAMLEEKSSLCRRFNRLKPTLVCSLFKNPVRTSKRTPNFTITKINWLILFKEIIAVYSEKHAKPIKTK